MKTLYIVEIVVSIISIIIAFILLREKPTKKVLKSLAIIFLTSILVLGITFICERPKLEITEKTYKIEAKIDNNLIKPKTTYHLKDITDKLEIVGNVNYDKIGDYEVTYKVPTLLGQYVKKQTINVVDTTPPEIKLEGRENFNQSYKSEYVEPGCSVVDAYDGDITDKVQVTVEKESEEVSKIIYSITDSSGNMATKVRTVTIVDDVAPEISINGNSTMTLLLGSEYVEKGATAIDEKDGDLTAQMLIEGSVDTSKEGEYVITYKIVDSKGNEAVQTRTVKVVKEEIKAKTGTDGEPGVIYLTFDDGPSTNTTPKILDILKSKNVKATFFILNYNSAGEALVKREVAEGHTVAIHGYSHDYSSIYQSVDTYMNNITKLQEKIRTSTGYNATITRFPGGSSNTVSKYNPGIMTKLCKEVVNRGYKYFDWNVSSEDAGGAKTSDDVYNNVIKGLKKSRANVVLMHDFSNNAKTVNALSSIIDYGIQNGYTFKNITESTPMITHKPNN